MSIKWTERKVAVSALKPYEKNPRKISDSQYAKLKASIQDMGYHQRLIVTNGYKVIGGHQRLRVLQEMGITEVTVLMPDRDLADSEYKRLLVSDNLPYGEFDWDMLGADFSLDELKGWGMPDDLLGKYRVPQNGLTDPDDVPEVSKDVITRRGDVITLGNHRLMCGDSTNPDDVVTLLGGAKPHLMVTDPPYGVNYDADWRNHTGMARSAQAIGKVENDDRADWYEAWLLFPGAVVYIWHAGNKAHIVADSIEKAGFVLRSQIVWAKSNLVISRGDYHPKHEPCWYAVRKGETGHWQGDRKQTTLWEIDKPQKSETGHSTQKPVECMLRPMLNNSATGDSIYEPFSGSGTTIMAGEISGRRLYAMELSPAYVDMAVKRWENYTGKKAELCRQE